LKLGRFYSYFSLVDGDVGYKWSGEGIGARHNGLSESLLHTEESDHVARRESY
jgi:hypothetical protein